MKQPTMTKREFLKRWRKAGCPRLYWKSAHRRWRWDSDVIAKTDGMYFKSWEGLEEFLEYCEALEVQHAKKREENALKVSNNCVTILAELVGRELGMKPELRNDGQPFIEYIHEDPASGKKHTFMRIDVKCQIFEDVKSV